MATALMVAEMVFEPAAVELRVPVATPLASVVPWIGFPFPSFAVTVMVEVPLPAVIGDVAATVDWVAETAPTLTTTVAVCVMATVLIVADTVFDPAAVELNVPVIWPLASVVPTGWVSVFPVVGLAASVTVAP